MPTPEEIAAAEAAEAEEAKSAEEAEKSEEKSEEEAAKEEPKKYSFGGNEYESPEEALEAAKNLEVDYTKKSQRLSELEKAAPPKKEEEFDPEDEKVADQLYSIIKKKHGLLTREEVEESKQLEDIDRTFKSLEKTYKGEDGLPKFNTGKVLQYMKDNGYPPNLAEDAFKKMNEKEFLAYAIKKANESKGGYNTETTKGAAKKVGKEKELNSKEDVENFVLEELQRAKAGETD